MLKHFILTFYLTYSLVLTASENPDSPTILVAGSTSVVQMLEIVQREFNQKNNEVLQLRGMGSDKGIKAIAQNIVDLGASSRYMTKLEQERWPHLKQIVVAQDALVFFTNISNKVNNMNTTQLSNIYSGSIEKWSDVSLIKQPISDRDNRIQLFSKDVKHGTFDVFLEFLSLDYMKDPQSNFIKLKKAGNRGLFSKQDVGLYNEFNQALGIVQRIPNAIAYDSFGAISQFSNLKKIDRIHVLSIDNVKPSYKTIQNGEYNFVRPLIIVVNTQSKASINKSKVLMQFLGSRSIKSVLTDQHYVVVN